MACAIGFPIILTCIIAVSVYTLWVCSHEEKPIKEKINKKLSPIWYTVFAVIFTTIVSLEIWNDPRAWYRGHDMFYVVLFGLVVTFILIGVMLFTNLAKEPEKIEIKETENVKKVQGQFGRSNRKGKRYRTR